MISWLKCNRAQYELAQYELALLMLLSCAAGAPLAGQTLQLADGQLLLASVEEATGDGLRVRRLDNGGVLDLRWDHLAPECALRVQRVHNLAAEEQQEILVQAHEVRWSVEGSVRSEVGKIVDGPGTDIHFRRRGVQFSVPRRDLIAMRELQVPVAQIYTKEEYYGARLTELAPGDDADKHLLFADELIRLRDYDHAAEHLATAKRIGTSKNPQRLDATIAQLDRYKAAQKERELLDKIHETWLRGQQADFDKGLKLLAQYEKDFAQGKLKSEFDQEKKSFEQARTKFLTQQIAEHWRRSITFIAEKKVAESGVTLAAVREYAETKMGDEIAARLAAQFKLTAEEVKGYFQDRAKFPVGKRAEHFAYSIGSWVLGEAAILKGTKQGQAQEKQPEDDKQQRDIERIMRAIRQGMERRQQAQRAQGGQEEQTDESWWQEASRQEKVGWLRAYYAEFGGQLVVTFAYTQECISCYGSGTVQETGGDGKIQTLKCFLCHGTKWLRSIKAY
jgi:hypothetical protein